MIRPDIQKKLDEIKDIKLNMRNSIHSRDVDIDSETLFKDYPHKIDEIPNPNYLYAITGNWDGELDTMYFNPDVHYIPSYTGVYLSGYKRVVLHMEVIELGIACFAFAPDLDLITLYPTSPPVLGGASFQEFMGTILVPPESVDLYKSADGWSDFSDKIEAM